MNIDRESLQKYYEHLVASTIRVKQPSDAQPIALICLEARERGENVGTWHASAQFYGYLHRCNCFPCTEKRKAA